MIIDISFRKGRLDRQVRDPLLPDENGLGPADRLRERMRPFLPMLPAANDEKGMAVVLRRAGLALLSSPMSPEDDQRPGSRFPCIVNVTDKNIPRPDNLPVNLSKRWGAPCALFSDVGKMPGASFNLPAGTREEGGTCSIASLQFPANVCDSCYALTGRYSTPETQRSAWQRQQWIERLLAKHGPEEGAVFLATAVRWMARPRRARATKTQERYTLFRLHDAGEFYTPMYARLWANVAALLDLAQPPTIRIWAPTRVWALARAAARNDPDQSKWRTYSLFAPVVEMASLPNVSIRPSAVSINVPPPEIEGLAAGSGVLFIPGGTAHDRVKKAPRLSTLDMPPPPPDPIVGDECIAPSQSGKCWGKIQCSQCWHKTKVVWYREHAQKSFGGTPKGRKLTRLVRTLVQIKSPPEGAVNRRSRPRPNPNSLWMVMDKRAHKVFWRSWNSRDAATGWARAIDGYIFNVGTGQVFDLDGQNIGGVLAVA